MSIKKLLMTLAIVAATSSMAMAEETAPAAAANADKKVQQEQKFEARKAEALKRMDNRSAEMQKKKACVEAAKDHEAMKACFPNRGKHGKFHGKGEKSEGAEAPQ